MSDRKEYLDKIQEFYEHKLRSQLKDKYSQCNTCDEKKEFIEEEGKLIYSCGSKSGKCGEQYIIHLAKYINYPLMKQEIDEYLYYYLDLDKLKNYIDVDKELKELEKSISNYHKIYNKSKKEYNKQNHIKSRSSSIKKMYSTRILDKIKQQQLLKEISSKDITEEKKQDLYREYIGINQKIKEDYESLVKETETIDPYLLIEEGSVTNKQTTYKAK